MDENLLDAYTHTDYRVRLAAGGWATISVDQCLPPALVEVARSRSWGFITAWHPQSTRVPRAQNRLAQRRLFDALRALPATRAIHPGVGVGNDCWREPSLWVVGPDVAALDVLAMRFGQLAYLHGVAKTPARLRCVSS